MSRRVVAHAFNREVHFQKNWEIRATFLSCAFPIYAKTLRAVCSVEGTMRVRLEHFRA